MATRKMSVIKTFRWLEREWAKAAAKDAEVLGQVGLCPTLERLCLDGRISLSTEDECRRLIIRNRPARFVGAFFWHCNKVGALARSRFCGRIAATLEKERDAKKRKAARK